MLIKLLPFIFMATVFICLHFGHKSRKPVTGNPVVFYDGGHIGWTIGGAISMLGFVGSLFYVAING